MARFTKHDDNGAFIGWDEIGGESNEATYPEDLFIEMGKEDAAIFASMNDGTRRLTETAEYSRDG